MLSQSLRDAWRSNSAPGNLVNLGIGIPTLVANYVPPDLKIFFQSENGLIGTGPIPEQGLAHPLLTDAGGRPISALPGASTFDSAMSFGLIRGGHVDVTVLGGLQVDAEGRLANWMIPGKMVPGMGGAMDLVSGAKRVIVAMQHAAKGKSKIVQKCALAADLFPAGRSGRHGYGRDRLFRREDNAAGDRPRRHRCRGYGGDGSGTFHSSNRSGNEDLTRHRARSRIRHGHLQRTSVNSGLRLAPRSGPANGLKSRRIVSTALRRRPATSNGSMSTRTGQRKSCRAARPSLTDFCHSALRRCSYARGQRIACVAELIAASLPLRSASKPSLQAI